MEVHDRKPKRENPVVNDLDEERFHKIGGERFSTASDDASEGSHYISSFRPISPAQQDQMDPGMQRTNPWTTQLHSDPQPLSGTHPLDRPAIMPSSTEYIKRRPREVDFWVSPGLALIYEAPSPVIPFMVRDAENPAEGLVGQQSPRPRPSPPTISRIITSEHPNGL
ncbi:hypothetical protein C2857_006400 [Epichloe festucae Fl1]|uniref:Uncharacterized protein n=1 Tax=Epichloe festucae (strain Fl1) TaxID=877507 RepID=A0A7S9KLN0_EPIFF|nr:hypothetical protein C2857_006400 [Epichloe festucae Fl1]